MVQLVAIAVLAVLAGCAACPDGPADVVPCDGVAPFPPLVDGEVLPVIRGLQGGVHVLLAAAVRGIDPGSDELLRGLDRGDLPEAVWTLEGPDGVLTVDATHRGVAVPHDDGWLLGPHVVVLRYYADPPEDVDLLAREAEIEAMDLTLTVEVEDRCGHRATDARPVRLSFPPPEDGSQAPRVPSRW